MAKVKVNKTREAKGLMIPLHSEKEFGWSKERVYPFRESNIDFATGDVLIGKLKKYGDIIAELAAPYLILSARTPFVDGKGHLDVIGCDAIFTTTPVISFVSSPNENIGPGKIEIWLEGFDLHEKITVEIRLTGYSYNKTATYEVRSSFSPGLYGYFPVLANSKIDLFFPDIKDANGKGLITIEPVNLAGAWVFYDVKVNIIK